MKVITWNVNGIRAVERKGDLQEFVDRELAEFFLFQEIKGQREQFSDYLTAHSDYDQYYHSAYKKGYAGTGIWVRKDFMKGCTDVSFHTQIADAPNMDEGRVSQLTFTKDKKTYSIFSIYFPNGGKSDEAWKQKLVFYDKVHAHMNMLRDTGHIVIVGGDVNVAHTEIDLARAKNNDGKIGFHPKERAWFDRLIDDNWIDVWRNRNVDVVDVYSWWDMVTKSRDRNVGWRIDYFFIEKKYDKKVVDVKYLNEQYGSDHCPLMITMKL
jgi:exodeoxyribonuclease III